MSNIVKNDTIDKEILDQLEKLNPDNSDFLALIRVYKRAIIFNKSIVLFGGNDYQSPITDLELKELLSGQIDILRKKINETEIVTWYLLPYDQKSNIPMPPKDVTLNRIIKLKIPYISQWSNIAQSHVADCGVVSVAMILNSYGINITPDELYSKYLPNKGYSEYTNFTEMIYLMNQFNVNGKQLQLGVEYSNLILGIDYLQKKINEGLPVITLIKYGNLLESSQINNFDGSHFFVVVGYDEDNIYVHDPLYQVIDSKGAYYKINNETFLKAWGGFTPSENPNFAALIPNVKIDTINEYEQPVIVNTPKSLGKYKLNYWVDVLTIRNEKNESIGSITRDQNISFDVYDMLENYNDMTYRAVLEYNLNKLPIKHISYKINGQDTIVKATLEG